MMDNKNIILIYDADAGLVPMLADVVKKTFGFEECPLCEITYNPLGKKGEWKSCETKLPYPVVHKHRNEISAEWRLQAGTLPVVALQNGNRLAILLDPAAIKACSGDPRCLDAKIRERVQAEESRV